MARSLLLTAFALRKFIGNAGVLIYDSAFFKLDLVSNVVFLRGLEMKNVLYLMCALFADQAIAGIYKCESPEGKVVYQSSSCPEQAKGREIEVEKTDPEKIEAARQKLQEELSRQAESDAEQDKAEAREREVRAIEESNRAADELSESTREAVEALEEVNPYYLDVEGNRAAQELSDSISEDIEDYE